MVTMTSQSSHQRSSSRVFLIPFVVAFFFIKELNQGQQKPFDFSEITNQRNDPQLSMIYPDYENEFLGDLIGSCPILENNPQEPLHSPQERQLTILSQMSKSIKKKKKKNTNVIKMLGQIILNNMKNFKKNEGVRSFQKETLTNISEHEEQKKKLQWDKMNLKQFGLLFQLDNSEDCRNNLKATKKSLTKNMRRSVLDSYQMSKENKVLYLKTLKCSALRCASRRLVTRLAIPQQACDQ